MHCMLKLSLALNLMLQCSNAVKPMLALYRMHVIFLLAPLQCVATPCARIMLSCNDPDTVQWNLGIKDIQGTVKNCPEF